MPYGPQPYRPPVPRVSQPRSPNNRAGPLGAGASPFPTLSGALSPNNRAGPLGVGRAPIAQAPRAPAPKTTVAPPPAPRVTADQTNTNPQAPTVAYDYSADPILNQIQAIGVQDRATAESNAVKLRKQLAIDYGDADLAKSLFGANDPTAAAAAGNPGGVFQQLEHGLKTGTESLEDQYNKANLGYSGARIKGLSDFTNQYQGQRAQATGQEQSALSGITTNLAAALAADQQRQIQAEQDASDRALQQALLYGINPGAADTSASVDQGTGAVPLESQSATGAPIPIPFFGQGPMPEGGYLGELGSSAGPARRSLAQALQPPRAAPKPKRRGYEKPFG